MREMEHKPHEGAAGTEQDKWKKELESKALWREWVEGGWLGNRGLLERHHSFPYLSHISLEKSPLLPLPNVKGSCFVFFFYLTPEEILDTSFASPCSE